MQRSFFALRYLFTLVNVKQLQSFQAFYPMPFFFDYIFNIRNRNFVLSTSIAISRVTAGYLGSSFKNLISVLILRNTFSKIQFGNIYRSFNSVFSAYCRVNFTDYADYLIAGTYLLHIFPGGMSGYLLRPHT